MNIQNTKYSTNIVEFNYIKRKNCKHCQRANMRIEPGVGLIDKYSRCVKCGVVLRSHVDNIQNKYY
jgi:hypothetical protein